MIKKNENCEFVNHRDKKFQNIINQSKNLWSVLLLRLEDFNMNQEILNNITKTFGKDLNK